MKPRIISKLICSLLLICIIGIRFFRTILNLNTIIEWNFPNGLNIAIIFLLMPYIVFGLFMLSIWLNKLYFFVPLIIGSIIQVLSLIIDIFISIMTFTMDDYFGYSPILDIFMIISIVIILIIHLIPNEKSQ